MRLFGPFFTCVSALFKSLGIQDDVTSAFRCMIYLPRLSGCWIRLGKSRDYQLVVIGAGGANTLRVSKKSAHVNSAASKRVVLLHTVLRTSRKSSLGPTQSCVTSLCLVCTCDSNGVKAPIDPHDQGASLRERPRRTQTAESCFPSHR